MDKKFYLYSNPGLDRIRAFFWSEVVPMPIMNNFRDFLGPYRVGRFLRKILFPPAMRPGYDFFDFHMEKKHLIFIKGLKSPLKNCSYRYLSQEFAKKFPETQVQGGDQMDGQWLSQYAFAITKDTSLE